LCTTEREPAPAEDRTGDLDNDVISLRSDHEDQHQQQHLQHLQQQQKQQQLQLQVQLKQAHDREMSAARQLETANKTIEDLQENLDSRMHTIEDLRYRLKEQQQQQQQQQQQPGRSLSSGAVELKSPIGDMLFAFLSYTLTTANQQSQLLDSLTAGDVITAKERWEIQSMTTLDGKSLALLSRLRRMSTDDVARWLTTVSSVGQKQLVDAKLRTFCKCHWAIRVERSISVHHLHRQELGLSSLATQLTVADERV